MQDTPRTSDQTAYRTVEGVAAQILAKGESAECLLRGGPSLFLPGRLAASVLVGSTIKCAIPVGAASLPGEILIFPPSSKGYATLRARIAGTARPKSDQRGRPFVTARIEQPGLGIECVYLPCTTVRNYFYTANRAQSWSPGPTLYELLHVPKDVAPSELRVAFHIASLEMELDRESPKRDASIERAFNLLAQPELRASYDLLLTNEKAPVLFPYGGCGTLTAAGFLSPDGTIFFCHRVASFLPDTRRRRLSIPIRRLLFLDKHAQYKDSRHHVEVLFDRELLRLDWDSSWNQWKQMLGAEIVVQAEFTQRVRWKRKGEKLEPSRWETPLPSRMTVELPKDVDDQIRQTKKRFHELGKLSDAVEMVRARLECEAIEQSELRRIFQQAGPASDFDPSFISWQPNYDRYFYEELCQRAEHLYFFRKEYIIETGTMLIVEIPSRGHATYLFATPKRFREFMAYYISTTKDDIRTNKNGIAEKLGFVARIIHGRSRRQWLHTLQLHLGEAARGDAD